MYHALRMDNQLPYNTNNMVVDMEIVKGMMTKHTIDMLPRNLHLYQKAFIHKSYCVRKNETFLSGNKLCPVSCVPLQEHSNETLEHLGDSVVGLIVTSYLKRRYPEEDEGFLTILRSKLVKGETLAKFAETLNFGKYMVISTQVEANDGRTSKKLLEDVFEAFVGAIFEDYNTRVIKSDKLQGVGIGYQVAEKWLIHLIENNINFSKVISDQENFKEKLINYTQTHFKCNPSFKETRPGACVVKCGDTIIGCGEGSNRKQAEMEAARNALKYYGVCIM